MSRAVHFRRAAALLLAALLLTMTACSAVGTQSSAEPGGDSSLERYRANFIDLFDTITAIVGYAESEDEFNGYVNAMHDELLDYHRLYDIYNDYDGINNIKTINDNAGGEPVKVDQKIIDLLLFSREMYDLTGGQTNVMMGSVLSIWHDYREAGINNPDSSELPGEDELREAAEHVSIDSLVIDEANSTVQITDPEARLDVGAVAKGYATQKVCETLPEGMLVSVGGNVCSTGPRPDNGGSWVVGVENPDGDLTDYLLRLDLDKGSIVSSGDYQRYYTVDGVRYCHIIDPQTLYPPRYWRSVSVIYSDSGAADALSTALFTLDEAEGQALLDEFPGAEAMWVADDGTMSFSPGFEAYVHPEDAGSD